MLTQFSQQTVTHDPWVTDDPWSCVTHAVFVDMGLPQQFLSQKFENLPKIWCTLAYIVGVCWGIAPNFSA